MFKSFVNFEFIPVYGVSWWSSFIFWHVPLQFSQHHLLKRLFLLLLYACTPFVKYLLTIETSVCFWALCSVQLIYVSVLMPVPDCFDYNGLVLQFDTRFCDPSYFILLFQNCWDYSGSFFVLYKFLEYLFCICEICRWYLNRNYIESIDCFG